MVCGKYEGYNSRKTGPLLREVIAAPRGIAHIIKSTFGSADNIPDNITSDASNVGHSTFYSSTQTNDRSVFYISCNALRFLIFIRFLISFYFIVLESELFLFRSHKLDLENCDVGSSPAKRGHKRNETLPPMAFNLDNLATSSQSEMLSYNEREAGLTAADTMVELHNDIQELKAQNHALLEQLNKLQVY